MKNPGEMTKRVLAISRVSLFPAEHGGAKNILSILSDLAQGGVECRVLVKLHPDSPTKIRFAGQHPSSLKTKIVTKNSEIQWTHKQVSYIGVPGNDKALAQRTQEEMESFSPDSILLCDDGLEDSVDLFEAAASKPEKLVFLAQTIHCLPFGPYSISKSERVSELIRNAKRMIAPSRFVQQYIEKHHGGEAVVYYPKVFGNPPFSNLGSFTNKYITMINPCPWKGSSIFLKLVKSRPDLQFAAVPTWGTTTALLDEMNNLPNLTLLPETTQIDEIFKDTRILLTPSLCQEAFGLVSPEALLRGIPVIASNLGGLRESTLGVCPLVDVNELSFNQPFSTQDHPQMGWIEPENPVEPWSIEIDRILSNQSTYDQISKTAKRTAEIFHHQVARQSISQLI